MKVKSWFEIILLFILLFGALSEKTQKNLEPGKKSGYNNLRKLENPNFIKVKYKEKAEYLDGFKNDFREGISQIKKGKETFSPEAELIIVANEEIEIYFSEPIKSLKNFFGYNSDYELGDINRDKILSVDLSNFDSSSVIQTDLMFYDCISIEQINFLNFKATGIKEMGNMFYNCKALKSLDLYEL